MNRLRILQYGLGPIGVACIRALASGGDHGRVSLVGAVDTHPDKVNRDAGTLSGVEPLGISVSSDAHAALASTRPDVVLHTTSSFLPGVTEQLMACLDHGAHVVSSTEELAFPFRRHPELSARLDEHAKRCGKVIVGTGVNPGYAMDTFALAATGVCLDVRRIRVERVVDAGKRRLPLQKKVGAGITEQEFTERARTGTFGHIGLVESLLMLAAGLGWSVDQIDESLNPMIADGPVDTPYVHVEAGQVAGIHHVARGRVDGVDRIELDLKMYVGAREPRDAVHVEGDPPIDLVVRDGIFGDTATVAALINTAGVVAAASPGLRTMTELPVPRALGGLRINE